MSRLNCNIQWKKSRARWLKEGDANSKYLQGSVNKKERWNKILSLDVDDRNLTSMEDIINMIIEHFRGHFWAKGLIPIPTNLNFKRFDDWDNDELIRVFSEEEI